jgi:hypothetical protein
MIHEYQIDQLKISTIRSNTLRSDDYPKDQAGNPSTDEVRAAERRLAGLLSRHNHADEPPASQTSSRAVFGDGSD